MAVSAGVAVAFRRARGRLGKTGGMLAAASGLAGFLAASRRWELQNVSSEEILKALRWARLGVKAF